MQPIKVPLWGKYYTVHTINLHISHIQYEGELLTNQAKSFCMNEKLATHVRIIICPQRISSHGIGRIGHEKKNSLNL